MQESLQPIIRYNDLEKLLLPAVADNATDGQLKTLAGNIDFNTSIRLYFNGIQIGADGQTYSMLQYKYANDISTPPMKTINIAFDNNNKIVNIQPLQRGN